jgi:hypothetical protein
MAELLLTKSEPLSVHGGGAIADQSQALQRVFFKIGFLQEAYQNRRNQAQDRDVFPLNALDNFLSGIFWHVDMAATKHGDHSGLQIGGMEHRRDMQVDVDLCGSH